MQVNIPFLEHLGLENHHFSKGNTSTQIGGCSVAMLVVGGVYVVLFHSMYRGYFTPVLHLFQATSRVVTTPFNTHTRGTILH